MSISFDVSAVYFVGGSILGCLLTLLYLTWHNRNEKISGVLMVDTKNNLCKVMVTSQELSDRHVKKAIFLVDHNQDLSREEHSL